jgi:hypothetical protein
MASELSELARLIAQREELVKEHSSIISALDKKIHELIINKHLSKVKKAYSDDIMPKTVAPAPKVNS